MINGQSYAISIEHILCRVFKCERFGFGGVVNSDFIRRQPFSSMMSGLAHIYANADNSKREEIEEFLEDNLFYSWMSIDELLSFENATKDINGINIDIGYENGEVALEKIINAFRGICE